MQKYKISTTKDYTLKENIGVSALMGTGDYSYRSNPAKPINDRQFTHDVIIASVDYENGMIGSFQYLYGWKRSFFETDFLYIK